MIVIQNRHPTITLPSASSHPESRNQAEDIQHLLEKVNEGCDFLTTQMFFDNNLFYTFLYKIRDAGITAPVIPGIMPITKAIQLERAVKLSGSFITQRFKALVDHFGTSDEAMKQAASFALADLVAPEELNAEYILPLAFDKRIGPAVSKAVAQAARDSGVARL